jgi:hypothetical protein
MSAHVLAPTGQTPVYGAVDSHDADTEATAHAAAPTVR